MLSIKLTLQPNPEYFGYSGSTQQPKPESFAQEFQVYPSRSVPSLNSDTALIYHGQAASLAWSEIWELITDGLANRVTHRQ